MLNLKIVRDRVQTYWRTAINTVAIAYFKNSAIAFS
jgi:hypothetical protein